MPAGEPVLGSSGGDRQLLGNDLKDSNASMRHARDCQPTPDSVLRFPATAIQSSPAASRPRHKACAT